MTAWQVHKGWISRAVLVLGLTGLIDAAVGGLLANPFPWVVLIPGTLPLTVIVFVAMPLLKKAGGDS